MVRLPKIKDRITLGILAGTVGATPPQLINAWLYRRGVVNFTYGQLAAAFFTRKPGKGYKANEMLNGRIVNGIIRASKGVVISYLLSATGRDNAILKGASIGGLYWLGILGLTQRTGMTKPLTPISITGAFLVGHTMAGALTAALVAAFGHDSLFPSKEQLPLVAGIANSEPPSTRYETRQGSK